MQSFNEHLIKEAIKFPASIIPSPIILSNPVLCIAIPNGINAAIKNITDQLIDL